MCHQPDIYRTYMAGSMLGCAIPLPTPSARPMRWISPSMDLIDLMRLFDARFSPRDRVLREIIEATTEVGFWRIDLNSQSEPMSPRRT